MKVATLLCLLACLVYAEDTDSAVKQPKFSLPERPESDIYFFETFSSEDEFDAKWITSEATKDGVDEDIAKYDGEWSIESPTTGGFDEDQGLVMKDAAKHYAIGAMLERPFTFEKDDFVMQYEVNFQEGLSCGGAYVKLLSQSDSLHLEELHEKTPYTIMFGPDKCGQSSKVHFIFRHKNPVTGEYEEKHAKAIETDFGFFDDKKTHLFKLIVKSDNTYNIAIDDVLTASGSLLEDFTPPVNPPKEIEDPDDKKPSDWDEREKIPDPSAVKPDDWDEDAPLKITDPNAVKPDGWLDDGPEYIPDPDASQPDDWDEEEDGEWEAPTIPNPACEEVGCGEWKPPLIANPDYKGKWSAPLMDNPLYQGIWKPRRIPNPAFFEDNNPYKSMTPIGAIALELWTMSKDVHFDNFIITSSHAAASSLAAAGWRYKMEWERDSDPSNSLGPFLEWFVTTANERPYLWLIYVLVLVMPFVLCAACCIRSKPAAPTADDARRKKTDEPTPDDETDAGESKPPEPSEVKPPEPSEVEPTETKPSESFVASAEDEEEGDKPPAETESKSSSRAASRQSSTRDEKQSAEESIDEDETPADNSDEKAGEDEPAEETKRPRRRKAPRRET
ncbi:calnexin-like [Dysidea avara]|uniref:calnexin-like n=1 Tax=Dysidea avara TaxID=196820 RepID=UPI00332FBF01